MMRLPTSANVGDAPTLIRADAKGASMLALDKDNIYFIKGIDFFGTKIDVVWRLSKSGEFTNLRGATEPISASSVLAFPPDGMSDIPIYGASETPDPVPPNGHYPIGYPITLQPAYGVTLTVDSVELPDSTGTLIGVYPLARRFTSPHAVLIPVNPLRYSTGYTAHVRGQVDSVAFDKTWSFTTTDCTYRLDDGTCLG